MNNNTYLAEKISDHIYFKSPLLYLSYINNLLYGALYDLTAERPGDDPYDVARYFNLKNRIDFKLSAILHSGIKSLLLNATTYSFFSFAFTNKPYRFRLPNVFPYTTTKGMSYKIVSGYEVSKSLNLIFGFESVFGKEVASELTLGLNHQACVYSFSLSYKALATFGQGLNLKASAVIPISRYLNIGLGVESYSVTSLMGQRHALSNMKEGSGYSTNLSTFIQYRY